MQGSDDAIYLSQGRPCMHGLSPILGCEPVYHMKKFAEVCLYNQCTIFIAAATNHVNTNVLMMWQKTQTFTLKSVLLSL